MAKTIVRQRIFLVFALFFSASAHVSAQNSQELLDVTSKAYTYLDSLFLEKGLALPNKARPWSVDELRFELSRIDPAGLSAAGSRAHEYIAAIVDRPMEGARLRGSVGISMSPEAFARAMLGGEGYDPETYDWNHGYEDRKAFLEIPLQLWLADSFYAISKLVAKEEHATVGVQENYTNVIIDDPTPSIDLYFPFKAYSSLGGPGWSFRFGRDSLSWGNGSTGNMLLSDYSDFYDYLGIALSGDLIKLSSVYASFDARDPKTLEQTTTYSALAAHRLDIRIFNRLSIAINESVSFGGILEDKNPDYGPELVKDMNPFMIFHNWTIPWRANSLLSFEVNYAPWRWFELYGQIAMDEFATKYESERDGGGGPPIFGYMAGVNGAYPLGEGYLRIGLEWAMTSPWLYNRKAAPYYYNVRRYWSLLHDQFESIVKPIGYRFGPDALVWDARASWDIPNGLCVAAEATWSSRGEKSIVDDWGPLESDITPTGTYPERTFALVLDASYPLFPWLEVGGGADFISKRNTGHVAEAWRDDLEFNVHVTAGF